MKIAKATEKDFVTTVDFLNALDNLFDSRPFFSQEDSWKDWDDDDQDKKLILEIRQRLASQQNCWEQEIDNELLLFHFIKTKFKACELNWRRVVFAGSVLIENCCDPNRDTLEYHPFIDRSLSGQMLGADSNEFEME